MTRYEIEWTILDFMEALREGFNEDYDLYYLGIKKLLRGELLYIGKVYKQSVS